MLLTGIVGQQFLADGATPPAVRLDRGGAMMVTELNGRYAELVSRGLVFLAANQAATALSLLSATATGLILTNPAGSGKQLVILDVCVSLATSPAGIATLAHAANVNTAAAAVTHTTPLSVRNAQLGNTAVGVGLADGAATLPAAPVVVRGLGGGPVAASSITPPFIRDEVAGQLILLPGTAWSLTSATTAISVIASIHWAELPL